MNRVQFLKILARGPFGPGDFMVRRASPTLPRRGTPSVDRLARFQREAQVLASLNHPHIAQIYGLEDGGAIRALGSCPAAHLYCADNYCQSPPLR